MSDRLPNLMAGDEDSPPRRGTWIRLYAAVVVYTLVLVVLLYWMTVALNR